MSALITVIVSCKTWVEKGISLNVIKVLFISLSRTSARAWGGGGGGSRIEMSSMPLELKGHYVKLKLLSCKKKINRTSN